jgi:hypothetical protein
LKRYSKLLICNLIFLPVLIVIQGKLVSGQKNQVNIKKENGITVIENKGAGLFGKKIKDKIIFEEILSLGVDKGKEF